MNTASDFYTVARYKLLREWLRAAIFSFEKDRPDTPYQNGYLDALRAVQKEMEK